MLQVNKGGKRWYYNQGKWYASVTAFIEGSRPTPDHLKEWWQKNTKAETQETLERTASYGTLFHDLAQEFMERRALEIPDDERLANHLASLAQFAYDYNVEPMHAEIKLHHDADKLVPLDYAGTCDLVCRMGEGIAIVDYKTGAIRDKHKFQIMCYALAYAEREGLDVGSLRMMNFRPKDWRRTPTYELKEWRVSALDWEELHAMSKIFRFSKPSPVRRFERLQLGTQPQFTQMEAEEWIEQEDSESWQHIMD